MVFVGGECEYDVYPGRRKPFPQLIPLVKEGLLIVHNPATCKCDSCKSTALSTKELNG